MFPQFNIRSMPLLILVLQGLIFAGLLFYRYRTKKKDADALMALFLVIMAYHRTTYTIGFMGWYDTFKNTKINYYLLPLGLSIGPIIYLYVRTTVSAPFKLIKRDWLHFIPILIYLVYKLILLLHDINQPGWDVGYTGEWKGEIDDQIVDPIMGHIIYSSQLLYLTFTVQLFLRYRTKIKEYFSTTYSVELNWIRNFLAIYIALFLYTSVSDLIDAYVVDLDYVHWWWSHLFSAIAIVYLGVKAYFTDLNRLHGLTFDINKGESKGVERAPEKYVKQRDKIIQALKTEEAFLNADLTLKDLATSTKLSTHEVSESINHGFGKNFNELVNSYRVEQVKQEILDPKNDHLSLVAIAFDAGFNSKATFNRVFKKHTGLSPSQFKANSNRS